MSLKHFTPECDTRAKQDFVRMVSPDLPFVPARLCLIFGNRQRENVHNMALYAARLYHKGHIKKIIVTGGVRFNDDKDLMTEAQYARRLLIASGVQPNHIIFENKSSNTYENVKNARQLVKRSEGTLRREPMICLGREYATSRFLMTLAKTWPEITTSFVGFDLFDKQKSEWHTCNNVMSMLREDQEKWPEYIRNNHIKPINPHRLRQRLIATTKPRKLTR